MTEFVTPVVGQQYNLGGEVVEVVEAVKKRYWRILVSFKQADIGPDASLHGFRTIPQAEWAAKASHVGAQG